MFGLSTVAPGYRVKDLSRAKDQLLSQLAKQHTRSSPCPCCLRCGRKMAGPTLYTADAGQAFEMIDPSRVRRAFRIIFKNIKCLTGRSDPTLSCLHTSKSKVRFGGWIRVTLFDRSVFYLSKVSSCMQSLLKLRWYRFGDLFLEQVSGIPIGGPVSGAVLESVLCVDEDSFEQNRLVQVFQNASPFGGTPLLGDEFSLCRRRDCDHEMVLSCLAAQNTLFSLFITKLLLSTRRTTVSDP